ncbi:MAG TPA: acyltransferase [Acidisarcina sp.]
MKIVAGVDRRFDRDGNQQRSSRLEELDSLRGLAAVVVFIYHCIFLSSVHSSWVNVLVRSPLGLFVYGGHQAVILFFILSGFVLYLPYTRSGHRSRYLPFIVKRICRIYLPYLFALGLFVAAYLLFFRPLQPEGLSMLYEWRVLSTRELLTVIRDCVVFVGIGHREYLNGATWTLVEEMRISFVFPLLAALVLRVGSKRAVGCALGCSALVSVGIHIVHHRTPLETFHYAAIFVLGAVLSANRTALVSAWERMSRVGRVALTLISICGCAYAPYLMSRFPAIVTEELADWLIAVTASVFLISALADTPFRSLLRHRVIQHLGRTSYGIYLLHLPIIFIGVNLLWSRLSHPAIFVLAFVATLLLAHLFYEGVERPSMALGKRLARRLEGQGGAAATVSGPPTRNAVKTESVPV